MGGDLDAYLAAKYMSGPKADAIIAHQQGQQKRKKKKLKSSSSKVPTADDYLGGGGSGASTSAAGAGSGLVIGEDDSMDWAKSKEEEDDEFGRPVVEHKRNAFAPAAKSAWNKVRVSEGDDGFGDDHGRGGEQDEREPEDEAPAVVSVTQDVAPADDGPRALQGGIQSAASLREENERRKAKLEKQRLAAEAERALARARARENGEDSDDGHDETVYRDSSGKRIDTKAQKAELARKRREDMEKQMQRMEWGKGEVQKENQEAKRRELESMRYKPAARYADDVEMNEEMKDQDRWNDPAASFLTTTKKKSKGPRRPQYTGPPPPPNRFGIAPGYRWDGVDRSNGFERQLMQSGNSRRVRDAEAYAWGAEDM